MRRVLTLLALLAVLLLVRVAHANDLYLGTVYSTDAGSGANAVFNWTALDAGFVIPPMAQISVQPDGGAYVCVDSHVDATNKGVSCSPTTGVLVPVGALFQTSCSSKAQMAKTKENVTDGGAATTAYTPPTCTVACVPLAGSTVSCSIFKRNGNEN